MKNINATNKTQATTYSILFEIDVQKCEILTSEIGSLIADAIFSRKENTTKYTIGVTITNSIKKIEIIPIEFFIITPPAIIKSKPSLIKPPTIGTVFDIAYFAVLIEIPSNIPDAIP